MTNSFRVGAGLVAFAMGRYHDYSYRVSRDTGGVWRFEYFNSGTSVQ